MPVEKRAATPTAEASVRNSTKEDIDRERKYKAEDALRTVSRYHEIKKDKRLCSDMKELAKAQVMALNKVVGE